MRLTRNIPVPALALAACLGLLVQAGLKGQVADEINARMGWRQGGLKPAPAKELIYVCLPGTLEGSWDQTGNGIVVLDASNNYNFIKRIPTWFVPASSFPLQVSGVDASPATNMIYVAARGRLGAWDLSTEKMVWDNAYDGQGFERPQVGPDGSFMYVGSNLHNFWYVVDPRNGNLITKVYSPKSRDAHNLNLSQDGRVAFMAPNGPVMGIADTRTNKLIKTIAFKDNIRVFVLNHDSSLIYTNQNNLLGFDIADVRTGKVLKEVQVQGWGWPGNWNRQHPLRIPHGCPSHGIALTPDGKELWLDDGLNQVIHIFDVTQPLDPKETGYIKTNGGCYWITMGLDGHRAYCSSGDVIDVKTHQIIARLRDEYGRVMHSEKSLDMLFIGGKLNRVSNQFGNAYLLPSDHGHSISPESLED